MSNLKRVIHEIHRRSLWQVLGIYLAASYAVVEVVQTLTESLQLPGWFPAFAVVLLLAGLPVVLATAFVQRGFGTDDGAPEPPAAESREAPSSEPLGTARETAAGPAPANRARWRRLLTWRNALTGGVVAFALWGVIAAGWLLMAEPRDRGVVREADAAPAPAVAVLPFTVRGDGLGVWREGMVDLLSTGLDGVAGLRAVDSRTVLARWNERVRDDEVADQATALEVARAAGARYALIGSAVSVGPEVRFVADLYDVPRGELLGHPQVQGPSERVLSLVDEFAVESLLRIVQESSAEPPSVDLASVTTSSVSALTAWLEGESWFRRGDFHAAIAAYERAVDHDSTFALAWYQMANAYGWAEGTRSDRQSEALGQAMRWIDRLPARDAVLVRAAAAADRGNLDQLESLRRLVRRHPDDARAWYQLGEIYYHPGGRIPVSLDEAKAAFRKTLELDPGFAPYYLHPINIAFRKEPDSARIRELIDAHAEVAPEAFNVPAHELAFGLTYGDSAARARARAALDTVPVRTLQSLPNEYLIHPRYSDAFEAVLQALIRRGSPEGNLFRNYGRFEMAAIGRGQPRRGVAILESSGVPPWIRSCMARTVLALGLPVAPEALPSELPTWSDVSPAFLPQGVACMAAAAAEDGNWTDHRRAIDWLRARADSIAPEDSLQAGRLRDQAREAEIYGMIRRGETRSALRGLEELPVGERHPLVRWWLAEVYMAEGRWRDAIPWLRSFWWKPFAHADYHLGRAHEALGEREAARRAYAEFLEAWSDADPELQEMVESARRALERLTGEPLTSSP